VGYVDGYVFEDVWRTQEQLRLMAYESLGRRTLTLEELYPGCIGGKNIKELSFRLPHTFTYLEATAKWQAIYPSGGPDPFIVEDMLEFECKDLSGETVKHPFLDTTGVLVKNGKGAKSADLIKNLALVHDQGCLVVGTQNKYLDRFDFKDINKESEQKKKEKFMDELKEEHEEWEESIKRLQQQLTNQKKEITIRSVFVFGTCIPSHDITFDSLPGNIKKKYVNL